MHIGDCKEPDVAKFMDIHNGFVGVTEPALREARERDLAAEAAAGVHFEHTDLDHHDHEALGALDQGDGRGVGIARYVRSADDPYAADIAVTVVGDWQGRGLGTELLARLSDRAFDEGIHRFTALVAAENEVVGRLLRKIRASLVSRESSTLEYEIALVPGTERDGDRGGPLQPATAQAPW